MNLDKVKEIIVDELGCELDEVTLEAQFIDDLGADSLAILQLMMSVEEEFDIEIPEEDVATLKTVGDFVKYLEANIE